MQSFSALIEIIDINPYVEVPIAVLETLLKDAKRTTGPFPVKGTLQGKPYKQTVVKFRGLWRLYLNTPMRSATGTSVGDTVTVTIEYDPQSRKEPENKYLTDFLKNNKTAKQNFTKLPRYRQKEIHRYLNNLKSEESIRRNIEKIEQFLTGKKTEGVLFR